MKNPHLNTAQIVALDEIWRTVKPSEILGWFGQMIAHETSAIDSGNDVRSALRLLGERANLLQCRFCAETLDGKTIPAEEN